MGENCRISTHYLVMSRKKKIWRMIEKVFEKWIGMSSAAYQILIDNRLEFQNEDMKRLKERFNIELVHRHRVHGVMRGVKKWWN